MARNASGARSGRWVEGVLCMAGLLKSYRALNQTYRLARVLYFLFGLVLGRVILTVSAPVVECVAACLSARVG